MDPNVAERVSASSHQQGEAYFARENFGRAFAHFLVTIKLNPRIKTSLKMKFSECLEKWGRELEINGRFGDLFNCYEQAIEIYPENEMIYKYLGHILLRCGSPKEAADYFRKYIALDSSNLKEYRYLENACNLAVERWHFRMLNDQVRNLSFREAIIKKIKRGFRNILDIGTGTGILSLFAIEGGAREVFACDSSSAMTSIAAQVLEHHDITSVKLLTKHSTDLNIPEDIEQRVSLVLCEIVDCGLLGEHVLQTLTHAWEHLLEPNGVVLPLGAALHLCGVESEDVSEMWTLRNLPPDLGLETFTIVTHCEDYDTERLGNLPRGYRAVTDTVTPLTINFNDPNEMFDILEGKKDSVIKLTFNETCSLHCVAGWFTLSIDEDIALETGPDSSINSWEQAIFPCPLTIAAKKGDELELKLSFKSGKPTIEFIHEFPQETITVSKNVLRMLNDTNYVSALKTAAESLESMNSRPVRILDGSPFPIFGLYYLKKGNPNDMLVCTFASSGEQDLICRVSCCLGLDKNILCLPTGEIENLLDDKQKFDIILLPFIEESGELSEWFLSHLREARDCLNKGGLLLPQHLTVMGQLVESDWLGGVSRVLNSDVTCGYDIAPFINMYSVNNQIDFRLDSIEASAKCEPFSLIDILPNEGCEKLDKENKLSIKSPDTVNALTYWHVITVIRGNNSTKYSTKDVSSHIHQAAQLIDIKKTSEITLITNYDKGLIRTQMK